MSSFLDSTGLSRLVSKITDYFAKKDGTYPSMTVGRVEPRMDNPSYIQLDFGNTSWADFSGSGSSSLLQKVFGSNYAINRTITFIGRNSGLPNDWETNTGISAGPMKWGIVLGFKCADMWVVDFYVNNTYSGAYSSRVVRFGLGSNGIKSIEKFVVSHGASDVGSSSTPVYVKADGSVNVCTDVAPLSNGVVPIAKLPTASSVTNDDTMHVPIADAVYTALVQNKFGSVYYRNVGANYYAVLAKLKKSAIASSTDNIAATFVVYQILGGTSAPMSKHRLSVNIRNSSGTFSTAAERYVEYQPSNDKLDVIVKKDSNNDLLIIAKSTGLTSWRRMICICEYVSTLENGVVSANSVEFFNDDAPSTTEPSGTLVPFSVDYSSAISPKGSAVGSPSQAVYVNENGLVQPCKSIVKAISYCNGRIAKITWDGSPNCIPFMIKFMFDYGTYYHSMEEITCYGEINGSMNSPTLYIWGKTYNTKNPNVTSTSSLGWMTTADGIEIWASHVKAYSGAVIPHLNSARFMLLDVKCPSTDNVNIDIDTSFTDTWTPTAANSVDCNAISVH